MDRILIDPIDFLLSKALENAVLVKFLAEIGNSTRNVT